MRLAMVWRSLDIFSVVPRSVLTSAAAVAGAAGAAEAGSAGASGAGAAARLLRRLGRGEDVLLTNPAADASPVESFKVDAVFLGQFAHKWRHVGGLGVSDDRCRRRSRSRRAVLWLRIFRGRWCCDLRLGLWFGFGFRLTRRLSLRRRRGLGCGLRFSLRCRFRRCFGCLDRSTRLADDRKHRSDLDCLVFLHLDLQQRAGCR